MVLLPIAVAFVALSPALQPQRRELHERTGDYEIDFQYPAIPNASQFNAAVSRIVNECVEKFKGELNAARTPNLRNETPPPAHAGYLTGRYAASVLKNGITSALVRWTEYVPFAAHPWGGMASFNYDSQTGRVLAISDLFRPESKYVSRLSELAIDSLSRREFATSSGFGADMVRRGAGPAADNFKVFTLTDSTLVLHFPTYQVAPGAAGPQEVVIPLETLAPLLRGRYLPRGVKD